MTISTPAVVSDGIRQFSAMLVPGTEPIRVAFERSAGAQPEHCYENVAAIVEDRGGSPLLGWIIWEWPGVVLQAEFHAVWRSDDGRLFDPTPKEDGEESILFLADPLAVDDGGIVEGRYFALCDWEEVTEYIEVCRENERIRSEHFNRIGGIRQDIWNACLVRRKQASAKIERTQNQNELLNDVPLSQSAAHARLSNSISDIEASTTLARHLAANGDFSAAFETLLKTAAVSQNMAVAVGETFRTLFGVCEDQELVGSVRRQWSMFLH